MSESYLPCEYFSEIVTSNNDISLGMIQIRSLLFNSKRGLFKTKQYDNVNLYDKALETLRELSLV